MPQLFTGIYPHLSKYLRFTIIYMGVSILSLIEHDLPGFTIVYRDLPPHLHGQFSFNKIYPYFSWFTFLLPGFTGISPYLNGCPLFTGIYHRLPRFTHNFPDLLNILDLAWFNYPDILEDRPILGLKDKPIIKWIYSLETL